MQDKLLRGKYFFSLDFFISPLYSIHSYRSDHLYSTVRDINNNSVDPSISNEIGLGFNFHKKRSIFSSGLVYTTFRQNFNFLATDFILDSTLTYRYFTQEYMIIDTIRLINIDTLLSTGDTVYYDFIDTTQSSYIDSLLIYKKDTLDVKYKEEAINTYRYFEIPIKYSYIIRQQNFDIVPEIGIIAGFFVNSKGKIVSLANLSQSEQLNQNIQFAKVNLSIYTGLKFKYMVNRHFDFFTSAFYRTNVNSIFKNYPIISSFNNFGISFGIRYKFLL